MFSKIIGLRFCVALDRSDIFHLYLGEDRTERVDDLPRLVSDCLFSVFTSWRFREGSTVLMASTDLDEPINKGLSKEKIEYLRLHRDMMISLYNRRVNRLNARMREENACITDIQLTVVNDLVITFSNGVIFESLCTSSREDEESWHLTDSATATDITCRNWKVEGASE